MDETNVLKSVFQKEKGVGWRTQICNFYAAREVIGKGINMRDDTRINGGI